MTNQHRPGGPAARNRDTTVLIAALGALLLGSGCEDDSGGPAATTDGSMSMTDNPVDMPMTTTDARTDSPSMDGRADLPAMDGVDGPLSDVRGGVDASCAPELWRYSTPGCGAQAPEPVCWAAAMDACGGQHMCMCDGTVVINCEPWERKPWAYRMPAQAGPPPASCDPSAMPDAGAR